MVLPVPLPGKCLSAYFATKRSIFDVNKHVVFQYIFRSERLLADFTLVRFYPKMLVFVILEGGQRFHLDATRATRVLG